MAKIARCVVRLDPEIWIDADFVDAVSLHGRAIWFDSLLYLASIGEPTGYYPHVELVAQCGGDADRIAGELLDFGVWSLCALGYFVSGRSGCEVRPEARSPIPTRVRRDVYFRDWHRCVTCGSGEELTLDHIIPWSKNGSDDLGNLQTMCRSCNSRKGARV